MCTTLSHLENQTLKHTTTQKNKNLTICQLSQEPTQSAYSLTVKNQNIPEKNTPIQYWPVTLHSLAKETQKPICCRYEEHTLDNDNMDVPDVEKSTLNDTEQNVPNASLTLKLSTLAPLLTTGTSLINNTE